MFFFKALKTFFWKPINLINFLLTPFKGQNKAHDQVKIIIFCLKIDPYETVANPTESTQNLSPRRFWHAEVEFDVKNLRFRHPDLEIKENDI